MKVLSTDHADSNNPKRNKTSKNKSKQPTSESAYKTDVQNTSNQHGDENYSSKIWEQFFFQD